MTTTDKTTKYLTRQQVLARYGIGNTTLYRWIGDEQVKFPKQKHLGIRCIRFSESELEAWEAERARIKG
ncbi:AlpA family phage regulatory protein [Endozoicomonas sp. Mp262]|uniref:helix-turn-helix transcriptional regulator n=1 Tax=Endozoicomonas sp. Mp262 TaxID=2919499 RepID=UPI0021DB393D